MIQRTIRLVPTGEARLDPLAPEITIGLLTDATGFPLMLEELSPSLTDRE